MNTQSQRQQRISQLISEKMRLTLENIRLNERITKNDARLTAIRGELVKLNKEIDQQGEGSEGVK